MELLVGLVQSPVSEDRSKNLERIQGKIREAAGRGARIICLQELCRSPYFPRQDKRDFSGFAEPVPGETTRVLSGLARDLEAVIIIPLYERDGRRFFNTAVVVDADGKMGPAYRKVHIPHDESFYEKSYFEPGDRGFIVHKTRYADISVLICYDQWFPEAARACVLGGAQILFYPTAIGWIRGAKTPEGDWRDAWLTVQRGHAIANGVHVAAVNRVGDEGALRFWGTSFVCDPFGGIVAKAGEDEEVLVAPVDLSRNSLVREGWGFLRNRRPECYRRLAAGGEE